jgi:hypothetical protein
MKRDVHADCIKSLDDVPTGKPVWAAARAVTRDTATTTIDLATATIHAAEHVAARMKAMASETKAGRDRLAKKEPPNLLMVILFIVLWALIAHYASVLVYARYVCARF